MPNLVSANQDSYIANRFINEGARLISDILEVTDILNMEGYLLTIDTEKDVDSVDHYFLLAILEHNLRKTFYDGLKLFLEQSKILYN